MIEMHRNLGAVTLAEVDAKVKFPADATKRTADSRRTVPPTAKEFRAIVADLFLNEDTWAFDAQVGAVQGERIRKLMLANAPELGFVFNDIPGFVRHLDESIRDKVTEILTKLSDIPADSLNQDAQGNVAANTMQKLAEVEALVDDLVKSYADSMQEKVTKLFEVKDDGLAEKPLQYQTFAEISGTSALNPKTMEGRFTINVLKGYFKKSARVDQRAMLAATVGEALLCHVKTKDRPVTGEDCVIKVLRPNIYTAVLREKAIFDEIIEHDVPAMKRPFEMRYKGILEEFDLTIEAENIRLGRVHHEHPTVNGTSMLDISSMELVANVSPTTGTLVVKKADGVTYDKYIGDIHDEADETIRRIAPNAIRINGRVTRPCSSIKELLATRRRLEYLKAYLGEKRNHISDFAHAWFENGLYGDGFMHGDLHAGNIMVSDKGATVIDFGNCIRLSPADQDNIRTMLSKASVGYGEDAIKTFRNLLGNEAKAKLDATLADPQKEAFRKNLYGVFTKGTSADVMARIDGMIDTLVLDEASLPQVGDDAPKFVKDFMAFLGNLSSNPDKEFDYAKFASTANKFLYVDHGMKAEQNAIKDADGKIYGGAENVGSYLKNGTPELGQVLAMLTQDRAKFNATVMPLIEWLYRQQIPHDSMLFLRENLDNSPPTCSEETGRRASSARFRSSRTWRTSRPTPRRTRMHVANSPSG